MARANGEEMPPPNAHGNTGGVGAIDFTGDLPMILGPDAPTLGGFVCPACIVGSELWKIGQLRAGDKVRFRHRLEANALTSRTAVEALLDLPDTRCAGP